MAAPPHAGTSSQAILSITTCSENTRNRIPQQDGYDGQEKKSRIATSLDTDLAVGLHRLEKRA